MESCLPQLPAWKKLKALCLIAPLSYREAHLPLAPTLTTDKASARSHCSFGGLWGFPLLACNFHSALKRKLVLAPTVLDVL